MAAVHAQAMVGGSPARGTGKPEPAEVALLVARIRILEFQLEIAESVLVMANPQRRSAGTGAKGHRCYDWAWVDIHAPSGLGFAGC